jgi:hypothetical protein
VEVEGGADGARELILPFLAPARRLQVPPAQIEAGGVENRTGE